MVAKAAVRRAKAGVQYKAEGNCGYVCEVDKGSRGWTARLMLMRMRMLMQMQMQMSRQKKKWSTRDEVRIRRSSIGGTRCLCGTKARGSYN